MKPSDPSGAHLASSTNDVARLLAAHRAAGRTFTAAGVSSFVLDQGDPDAEPVVCIHGVPASAYLYRKVLPALAARSLRGIAVDVPGLGLAERPEDFDCSWTGPDRRRQGLPQDHARLRTDRRQAAPLPRRRPQSRLPRTNRVGTTRHRTAMATPRRPSPARSRPGRRNPAARQALPPRRLRRGHRLCGQPTDRATEPAAVDERP